MTTQSQNSEQNKPLTEDEIKTLRKRMKDSYEEELPILRLQSEHEKLLADIEESRLRRMTFIVRQAEIATRSQQAEGEQLKTERPERTQEKEEKNAEG